MRPLAPLALHGRMLSLRSEVTETSQTFTLPITLNEGTHTVSARLWGSGSDVVSSVVTQYESGYIPGQKLFVVDVGRIPD